jgi:hypothetical protein
LVLGAAFVIGTVLGYISAGHIYSNIQIRTRRTIEILQTMGDTMDPEKPEVIVFQFSTHVEIAARFVTIHMSDRRRRINYNGLSEMRTIFKRGLMEFPEEVKFLVSKKKDFPISAD